MDQEEIAARRVEAKKTAIRLFIFAMALLAVFVIAMFYRSAGNNSSGVKKGDRAVSTSKQAESKNSAKKIESAIK